jgi:hypothetical protein
LDIILLSLYFGNYYNTFLTRINSPSCMNHSTMKWSYHVSAQISSRNIGRFALRDIARISLCSEKRLTIYSVHRNYHRPGTKSFIVRKCQVFRNITQCRLVSCYRSNGENTIIQNVRKCLTVKMTEYLIGLKLT